LLQIASTALKEYTSSQLMLYQFAAVSEEHLRGPAKFDVFGELKPLSKRYFLQTCHFFTLWRVACSPWLTSCCLKFLISYRKPEVVMAAYLWPDR